VSLIAIIDDDASFRRATVNLVRSLGHPAEPFASAEAFLHSERISEACCVISDVQMPGMTGIELHKQLLAKGHRLPVIYVTAFPDIRGGGKELPVGTVGFLEKPFSHEQLIECLNRALGEGE
jgi:FixJ family two-component response regulator